MVPIDLLDAARNGNLTFLKSTPAQNFKSVVDSCGASCLHYAARGDKLEIVEFLVKNNLIDILCRSNVGATTAHDAAASGSFDTLKWLIQNTSYPVNNQDGTGASVVHLVARFGHFEMLEWLLDNSNCDTLLKSASGAIPLHFAVVGGSFDCVKLLLDESPRSVNLQLNNGVTAAYLACQEGQIEILKYLVLKANGNLKMNAFDGMTCVHAAGQLGRLECMKFLVKDQKINPNQRDFDGNTPLHFAASGGFHQVVDWLMREGGAKVTLDNLGGSPLHTAVQMGQIKTVQVLLNNGCNKNLEDNQGLTALDLAIKCRQSECQAILKGELTLPIQESSSTKKEIVEKSSVKKSEVVAQSKSQTSSKKPDINPSHRRSELFRPVSILSTVSSNSDFGHSDPQPSGKNHKVLAEVHTETGEKENNKIRNSLVLNKTQPKLSNPKNHLTNPVVYPVLVDSAPLNQSFTNNRYSFPEAIKSEWRPVSQYTNTDSNNNSGIEKRDIYKSSRTFSSESCKESGEIVTILDKMEGSDDIVENGVDEQGLNKSVIQIRNKDVTISHAGNDYDHVTNGDATDSEILDSNIARISIKGDNEPEERESPPLPPPPSPPQSTHSSPVKQVADYPPPPPPPQPVFNEPSSETNTEPELSKPEVKPVESNSIRSPPVMSFPQSSTSGRPDIATEILRSGGSSSLKKSKAPTPGGGVNCVFSFGSDARKANNSTKNNNRKSLKGEYDPKNFLNQIPEKDDSGVPIPDWRRQVLAKNLAQKTMEEDEENKKVSEREARFANVPDWKRAMIEKREQEKRAKEEELAAKQKPPNYKNIPQFDSEGNPLKPWQIEMYKKKNGYV